MFINSQYIFFLVLFVFLFRRFYNNTYTDAEKQDAINLFLGNYVPQPGLPALWDLDTDYYLHCRECCQGSRGGSGCKMGGEQGRFRV